MAHAPAVDLDRYLARTGHTGSLTPTLGTLEGLIAAHTARIPFEAIDVLLGRGVSLDPAAIDCKILDRHRGGYCFEHASLMRRVLETLGFPVVQHLARVCIGEPPEAPAHPATHASLRVGAEGRIWLVDVGFGGFTPARPLLWGTTEAQPTAYGTYRIRPTKSGWMLELQQDGADLQGGAWMPLYEMLDFPWQPVDYDVANHYVATHPKSHFRQDLMVALSGPGVRTTLSGNRLRRQWPDGTRKEQRLDIDTLCDALRDRFGLPVADDWRPALERAITTGSRTDES